MMYGYKVWTVLFLALLIVPGVFAIDFDQEISQEDREAFEGILEPVMKVYSFIKYSATVLAVLFLIFAGVTFIVNGGDPAKRESAKQMAVYIVVGLIIIWVAPLVVNFLVN